MRTGVGRHKSRFRSIRVYCSVAAAIGLAACSTASHDATISPADSPTTGGLAALQIDDHPTPDHRYLRDDWPTWEDLDGDGCNAREQVLVAQSTTVAQVDPFGCKVVAGDWSSSYDGITTSDPGDIDIDHVVPLENVHESGGWRWDAGRRRAFANDPVNLIAVSASSNRSKGSATPDQWRPPIRASWCAMATTWVEVKVTYRLTATTSERDALGEMLATCDESTDEAAGQPR